MICRLKVRDFRCFRQADILFAPGINLFIGNNGSGKTSLIEALDMLSRRRTFRTGYSRGVIRHQAPGLRIVAKIEGLLQELLVEKTGNEAMVGRMGHEKLSRSKQTRLFPLRIIHAGCHEIINTPSLSRQSIIDWGVFHVEHRFFDGWRKYRHALAQRNMLLHKNAPQKQFKQWDAQLSLYADRLDALRQAYIVRLAEKVDRLIGGGSYPEAMRPEMTYQRGWPRGVALADVLEDDYSKDKNRGYTQKGAHRARIVWSWSGRPNFTPSGGQKKMLFSAMLIGQTLLCEEEDTACCLAIDDFASELDEDNQSRLHSWLADVKSTIILTSLGDLSFPPEVAVSRFRIDQGEVVPV